MIGEQRQTDSLIPAFLRDSRVLQVIGQLVFVALLVVVGSGVWDGLSATMQERNLTPDFSYVNQPSNFDVDPLQKPDWYSSTSTYGEAFIVGVMNTLSVVGVGLVATTILGIFMGILLLSRNWLVRTLSRTYVELLRNTPLLVQLFIWFFVVMFALPPFREDITFPQEGVVAIGIRLFIFVIVLVVVWLYTRRMASDSPLRAGLMAGTVMAIAAIEIGFRLGATQEGWQSIYGSGDLSNFGFLLYFFVSVVLIAGSWYAPEAGRGSLMGLAIGQLIGGLLFYFGIIPNSAFRWDVFPAFYISIRGFVFPETHTTPRFATWLIFVVIGIVVAAGQWIYYGYITETTGRPTRRGTYAVLAVVGFIVLGWLIVRAEPLPDTITIEQDGETVFIPLEDAIQQDLLTFEEEALYSPDPFITRLPQRQGLRFGIGSQIAPEYMALFLGLVIYTSAFIAEIVRAGIQAVPHGQVEAARAVGLSNGETLRLIILPQALRVIIPPLTNQYLNLTKNSSLAVAIGYKDIVGMSQTIMNQSGQSIAGIMLIMIAYLIMSLTISVVMNLINRRFQLVTR